MKTDDNRATNKEKFTLLYAAQIKSFDSFIDTGFKVGAVLTIAFGWILSSAPARDFLRASPFEVWAGIFFLALLTPLVILFTQLNGWRKSERIHKLLKELDYVEDAIFEEYRLPTTVFVGISLLNFGLCLLIIVGLAYARFGTS